MEGETRGILEKAPAQERQLTAVPSRAKIKAYWDFEPGTVPGGACTRGEIKWIREIPATAEEILRKVWTRDDRFIVL